MDTDHSTMFTLLLELNVTFGQRWIQFELQNVPSRAFAIDGKTLPSFYGKTYTTSLTEVLYIHGQFIKSVKSDPN